VAVSVVMPLLGESVTEGTVEHWLKGPGDRVDKYEPIVEVNTDKVNVELPSPAAGILKEIVAEEGSIVEVGGLLALIEEAGAPAEPREKARPQKSAVAEEKEAPAESREKAPPEPVEAEAPRRRETPGRAAAPEKPTAEGRARATPRVRRLAQERGIDLATITGSGPGGRITEEDVQAAAKGAPAPAVKERAPAPTAEAPAPAKVEGEDEHIPLTAIRRTIAQRMTQSAAAPTAWLAMECDVSDLVRLRESLKESFRQREGVDLTYLPFVIKALTDALREYPILNASWGEDKIVVKKRINIAVAVDTPQGLMVPVIQDADRLSIAAVAQASYDLASRARAGKLRLEDVQGGTFTVDNTGAFGSIVSQPIINLGQAAILSIEAITKRPVVVDNDAIAVRSIVNICLSFDHRILDGAAAGNFLKAVKHRLQTFGADTPVY